MLQMFTTLSGQWGWSWPDYGKQEEEENTSSDYDQTCKADSDAAQRYNEANQTGYIQEFIQDNVLNIPCGVQRLGCQIYYYDYKEKLTKINIPNSVTQIDKNYCSTYTDDGGVFEGCKGLTYIEIPDSVTSIGRNAFMSCTQLVEIKLPNNINTIPIQLFRYCYKLQKVEIPSSVTSIETGAFMDCTSLQNITIPDTVKSMGSYPFYRCSSLKSVKMPSSFNKQSINSDFFAYCKNLQSVNIPKGTTTIEQTAFLGCQNLVQIAIPGSVYSISIDAFRDCTQLQYICYPQGQYTPSIHGRAFKNTRFDGMTTREELNQYCVDSSIYYQCTDMKTQYFAFQNSSGNYCIKDEYVTYYQIINDTIKEYVKECQSYYINDVRPFQCTEKCTDGWAKKDFDYQCNSQCQYYISQDQTWICTDSCPEEYQYKLPTERPQCVSGCNHGKYMYASDETNPKQCISSCTYNWYQYNTEVRKCTKNETCQQVYDQQNTLLHKLYTNNKQCVSQCQNKYWYKYNEQFDYCTQQQSCQIDETQQLQLTSLDYDLDQCITYDQCKQQNAYYVDFTDICTVYKSINQCSELSEYENVQQHIKSSTTDYKCVTDCDNSQVWYLSPFKQITCLNNCEDKQLYGLEVSQQQCMNFDICQSVDYFIMAYKEMNQGQKLYVCYYKENIQNCNQYKDVNGLTQYIYQQYNYCVDQCSYYWYQYNDQIKMCTNDNSCQNAKDQNGKELTQIDTITKQCMEQQDCSKQDEYFYVIVGGKCYLLTEIDACQELVYGDRFSAFIYQIVPTKQCTSKCPYNFYEFEKDILYCTEKPTCDNVTDSSNTTIDKVDSETKQCLDICPDNIWKMEDGNKICYTIKQCAEFQQDQQIIIDGQTRECIKKPNDTVIDDKPYIVDNDTTYIYPNVSTCEELGRIMNIIIFKSNDKYKCVAKCRDEEVWYYDEENQATCIDSCQSYELKGYELTQRQCVTQQQCEEQQYSLDLEYNNIYCYYIKNSTGCQLFQQYDITKQYIIKMEDKDKCTDCSDVDKQVINQDNILICVQQDIMVNQARQNMSIIVVVIVLAVILVVFVGAVVYLHLDKKKIQKHKAKVMEERQNYIQHIQQHISQNNSSYNVTQPAPTLQDDEIDFSIHGNQNQIQYHQSSMINVANEQSGLWNVQ